MQEFDFVVIGGGPSGSEVALKLRELGKKVCIIEKNEIGGVCLSSGCIPTKALVSAANKFSEISHLSRFGITARDVCFDYSEFKKFQKNVVLKLKKGLENSLKNSEIPVFKGLAKIKNQNTISIHSSVEKLEIEYKNIVLAIGTEPMVPSVWQNITNLKTSQTFWELEKLPENVALIGGGVIGCEYASSLADLGVNVTIFEKMQRLLLSEEPEISQQIELELKSKGVKIFLNTDVNLQNYEDKLEVSFGDEKMLFDLGILCLGRKRNFEDIGLENIGILPENLKVDSVENFGLTENVFIIGDIAKGPQLAHKGYYDAENLARRLRGEKIEIDYSLIPTAIFTHPEISRAGFTKAEVENKFGNSEVLQVKVNFAEVGKAVAENNQKGFLLINFLKITKQILGISSIGNISSEFSNLSSFIFSQKLTAFQVAKINFSHPTVGEIFKIAAERAIKFEI